MEEEGGGWVRNLLHPELSPLLHQKPFPPPPPLPRPAPAPKTVEPPAIYLCCVLPGAPTCTGCHSVLPAMNISPSQVLQTRSLSWEESSCISSPTETEPGWLPRWHLPLVPPSVCRPHFIDVQRGHFPDGIPPLTFYLGASSLFFQ